MNPSEPRSPASVRRSTPDGRERRGERRTPPLNRVLSIAWLVLVWVAVTGSYSVASVLGGIVVALLITTLFRSPGHDGPRTRVRPVALLRYLGHFTRELVIANIEVAAAVINPARVAHARGIVEVRLVPSSRLVGAVLANAVSLTPGTSIIEVSESPPSMHVHVLQVHEVDAVRSSIAELHWRLIAALGPADALDAALDHARELRERLNGGAGTRAADTDADTIDPGEEAAP